MLYSIVLNNKFYDWQSIDFCSFTGKMFQGNELVSVGTLYEDLKHVQCMYDIKQLVNLYNGFYAVVYETDDFICAFVDRIRSIPLFYTYDSNSSLFIISDDVENIIKVIGKRDFDPIAEKEFLYTGYVTGKDTLCKDIKQLKAGSYLFFDKKNNVLKVEQYYKFWHFENKTYSDILEIHNELDYIMNQCTKRLIKYAAGRQIVIPLSGGYDSRLLALMLKKLDYTNVLCFSYGLKDNPEAIVSQQVAKDLGFEWTFVEYTDKKMNDYWKDETLVGSYYVYGSNHVSLPVFQDFFAVSELKKTGKLNETAIFLPGHSGDFPPGSHIPYDTRFGTRGKNDNFFVATLVSHYSLVKWDNLSRKSYKFWSDRLTSTIDYLNINSVTDYANYFELWDWQERQAKFIVNNVRVYEFFGYDWYLPFWDYDYMFFWQNIPLSLRVHKSDTYDEYVNRLYYDLTGKQALSISNFMIKTSGVRACIKNLLKDNWYKLKLKNPYLFFQLQERRKIECNMIEFLNLCSPFLLELIKNCKCNIYSLNGFWALQTLYYLSNKLCEMDSVN